MPAIPTGQNADNVFCSCSSISNTAALAVANAIADDGCGQVQSILTSKSVLIEDCACGTFTPTILNICLPCEKEVHVVHVLYCSP